MISKFFNIYLVPIMMLGLGLLLGYIEIDVLFFRSNPFTPLNIGILLSLSTVAFGLWLYITYFTMRALKYAFED